MKQYSLVVMGAGGVGKSALTIRFVQNIFIHNYDPTIEDSFRKAVIVENEPYMLEILDTAGTEQFTVMRDLYFRSGDGFIFVYSVTSASTFKELSEMWQQLALYRQNTTVSVPLVLVGNKVDLVDERRVSSERGKLLAEEWGVPYIETSARTGDCVEDVFATVVRRIVENERQVKGDKEKRGWWSRRCSVL